MRQDDIWIRRFRLIPLGNLFEMRLQLVDIVDLDLHILTLVLLLIAALAPEILRLAAFPI